MTQTESTAAFISSCLRHLKVTVEKQKRVLSYMMWCHDASSRCCDTKDTMRM